MFILDRLDQSNAKGSHAVPTRVLLLFAIVLTPVGMALSTRLGYEVYADSKKIQAEGVVRDARVFVDEHRPARSRGPWLKEWLVEYGAADGPSREWFRVGRYRSDQEAQAARDIGKTVPVWYAPGAGGDATLVPPEVLRNLLWAGWSAVIGAAGLISTYALIRRRARRANRSAAGA